MASSGRGVLESRAPRLAHPAERGEDVAGQINTGGIHHLRLTCTDVAKSKEFYTGLLGFDVAADSPPADSPGADEAYPVLWGGCVLVRGALLLGLRPVAPQGDRFDEDRVGLDHLSFAVASRAELEAAAKLFDERGVQHGEIRRLDGFGIDILPFAIQIISSSS